MLIAYPVGDHHAVLVCLDSLHDAVDPVALYLTRRQPVVSVRGTHPVRLNDAHPQAVRLSLLLFHGQEGDCVPVHQIGKESELLELVEVIHPVCVTNRRICP